MSADEDAELQKRPNFIAKAKPTPPSLTPSHSAKVLVETAPLPSTPSRDLLPSPQEAIPPLPIQKDQADSNRESVKELRRLALAGQWSAGGDEATILSWKPPNWKLQVFVSSTFTDTYAERNVLLEELLPELRQEVDGIEVSFIDMRYGVRNSNTMDHKTWLYCALEIDRCRMESSGLYFVSLQADKYGYRPLPRTIGATAYEQYISSSADAQVKALAEKWYIFDENQRPPHYILRPLLDLNDATFWNEALPVLRTALTGYVFDNSVARADHALVIGASVTEWETRYSCGHDTDVQLRRLRWVHRRFHGVYSLEDDPKRFFCDAYDDDTQQRLAQLKTYLSNRLQRPAQESPLILTFHDQLPLAAYLAKDSVYEDYLCQWKSAMKSLFVEELHAISARRRQWLADGDGLNQPGDDAEEMLHHCQIAAKRALAFLGREQLLTELFQRFRDFTPNKQENPYHILGLIGLSGCGKTSFMAKLATTLSQWQQEQEEESVKKRLVIIRFCGTSRESSNGFSLLQSIVKQIAFHYEQFDIVQRKFDTFQEVRAAFVALLSAHPVALFLDSVDQLSDLHGERSQLSFVLGLRPHPLTRVFISTLPDLKDAAGQRWLSTYRVESRLAKLFAATLRLSFHGIIPDSASFHPSAGEETVNGDVSQLLTSLLEQSHRSCTPTQLAFVAQQLQAEPSILYLQLACRVIRTWTSDELHLVLAAGVQPLIYQLFEALEREFGEVLTSTALAVITFAVNGISDVEMLDVLSLDDAVIDSVFQYWQMSTRRLPYHVWSRLRSDLMGLLQQQEAGCWRWYHRQLQSAAELRYAERKAAVHLLLGQYFGNCVAEETRIQRGISPQPLVRNGCSAFVDEAQINDRVVQEAVYHLVRCYDALPVQSMHVITSMEILCASAKKGQQNHYLQALVDLKKHLLGIPSDRRTAQQEEDVRVVNDYIRWLLLDLGTILRKPATNMFSTCTKSQPFSSNARQGLDRYWNETTDRRVRWRADSFALPRLWVRARSLGGKLVAGREVLKRIGHSNWINAVAFSPDDLHVAVCSEDGILKIWDVHNGNLFLGDAFQKRIATLCYSPDGHFLVVGNQRYVKMIDVHTTSIVKKWKTVAEAFALAFSPCGKRLAVGGYYSKELVVYDVETQETIKKHCYHQASDIISISYHRHLPYIASLTFSGDLVIWDMDNDVVLYHKGCGNRSKVVQFRPGLGAISIECAVAVHGYGLTLLSCGDDDGDDPGRKAKCKEKRYFDCNTIETFCFRNDGVVLATGDHLNLITLYAVETGQVLLQLSGHVQRVSSLAFSHDDKHLVSGSFDFSIIIWDVADLPSASVDMTGKQTTNNVAKEGESGQDGDDYSVDLDDYEYSVMHQSASKQFKQAQATTRGHVSKVNCFALSPDNTMIVSASEDHTVMMWSPKTFELLGTLTKHKSAVTSVAFDKSGQRLASGDYQGMVMIWDMAKSPPETLFTERMHRYAVHTISFHPTDAELIASGGADGYLRCWNPTNGHVVYEDDIDDAVLSLFFYQDGQFLATLDGYGSFYFVKIANVKESVNPLPRGSGQVQSITMNADHTLVAVCINNRESFVILVAEFDLVKGDVGRKAALMLERHQLQEQLTAMAFSNDNSLLASGSSDGTIHVWSLLSEQKLRAWICHSLKVTALCFTADDRYLFSSSDDHSLLVWDIVAL